MQKLFIEGFGTTHLANVGNMTTIILNSHILLYLPDHVATQIHCPQVLRVCPKTEYDGARELVVCCTSTVLCVEDMDTVPATRALGRRGYGYRVN